LCPSKRWRKDICCSFFVAGCVPLLVAAWLGAASVCAADAIY